MPSSIPPAEVPVDARLVRALLREQHPDLAHLRLRRIGTGWDNEVFRLGAELTVRIPRRSLGATVIDTELRWLPELGPLLPLPTPVPVRSGQPSDQYPWRWSVCAYVPGRPIGATELTGSAGRRGAADLAGFLRALHVPAPAGAPRNRWRGVPLATRTGHVLDRLGVLEPAERAEARDVWERAVAAPASQGVDCWLHGDLHGLNVLRARARISGVLDFGDLCAGDPATDLASAWLLLDAAGRDHLRELLGPSDARWERGRGWALLLSVMFLAHSAGSVVNAAIGRRGLAAVLGRSPGLA